MQCGTRLCTVKKEDYTVIKGTRNRAKATVETKVRKELGATRPVTSESVKRSLRGGQYPGRGICDRHCEQESHYD